METRGDDMGMRTRGQHQAHVHAGMHTIETPHASSFWHCFVPTDCTDVAGVGELLGRGSGSGRFGPEGVLVTTACYNGAPHACKLASPLEIAAGRFWANDAVGAVGRPLNRQVHVPAALMPIECHICAP